MSKSYILIIASFVSLTTSLFAQQEFALLEQFNGRYDFTFVGNTMNYAENGIGVPCIIQTSSSAQLQLSEEDIIEKVYLYWSGSGEGDLDIKLNDIDIQAEKHFNLTYTNPSLNFDPPFFVAFADVTQQVLATGNGTYTVSELDVSELFSEPASSPYCIVATNYAGWALVIVYKNEELPINQINVYEGFKNVPDALTITLDNLNVIDNIGAKIGFVAWEGDSEISVNETLRINGNILSNPPLNPANNAFNGTNSITGSSELYNMDLDIYDIQDNIQIGDTTAEIQLTSGQDLVMISTVVTKLNSQLPDATITISEIQTYCNSKEIEIAYTVFNTEATDTLPAHTPISVYINDILATLTETQNDIPVGESENGSITVTISEEITGDIEVLLAVDDLGDGSGIVIEINENNNHSELYFITLLTSPLFNDLENLIACDDENQTILFDFSDYEDLVKQNSSDIVSFHTSFEDAASNINPIINTSSFAAQSPLQEIFVRIDNGDCHSITSFLLIIDNCSLIIVIDEIITECDSDQIEIYYTIFNDSSSYILPENTPIGIYADADLIYTIYTQNDILPNSSANGNIIITISENTDEEIVIVLVLNDTENNITIESNTSNPYIIQLGHSPLFNSLEDLVSCNTGHNTAVFDFSEYEYSVKINNPDTVSFHTSYQDASLGINPVLNISSYKVQNDFPKEIFVRIANDLCFSITSFFLNIRNCPPVVYNGVSANNDGYNDHLIIDGLYDIFMDFELYIYSRWGELIWKGNNNTP
ncbi:MAG: gliding motility-associated C-terminal domain-containing protein, partial [Flavobacteriaceae bacterium]